MPLSHRIIRLLDGLRHPVAWYKLWLIYRNPRFEQELQRAGKENGETLEKHPELWKNFDHNGDAEQWLERVNLARRKGLQVSCVMVCGVPHWGYTVFDPPLTNKQIAQQMKDSEAEPVTISTGVAWTWRELDFPPNQQRGAV